jgi:aspartyl-tRNA(Asn)/glutamyl-tRNA(Gln) amidotransferase subunit C
MFFAEPPEIRDAEMSIDRKTVDHVALLARLALTEEERERTQEQLSAILEHINVIAEADTSQVPATAHILPVENVMAADKSRPCCAPDELLANAPAREGEYFRVLAVLEE